MTKQTQLKYFRKHRPAMLKDEFKEVVPREPFRCVVCRLPMFLSIGQIAACHSHCKAEYKRRLKVARRYATKQQQRDANRITTGEAAAEETGAKEQDSTSEEGS